MTAILLLTHDMDAAKDWVMQQDIENVFILDERELATLNKKFQMGFLDVNYSNDMVEYMRISRMSYKSSRPLVMLMDMRHQTAIEKIQHNVSVLLYDGSLSKRIVYNPCYNPTHIVKDFGSKMLQELLQKTS